MGARQDCAEGHSEGECVVHSPYQMIIDGVVCPNFLNKREVVYVMCVWTDR